MMNNSGIGRGNRIMLNVNAAEYRPAALKEDGDRPNILPSLSVLSAQLRSCLNILSVDESQYVARMKALAKNFSPMSRDAKLLKSLFDQLIMAVEEDASRSNIAARITNTLIFELGSQGYLHNVVQEQMHGRTGYWCNPTTDNLDFAAKEAFAQFLADLYVTITPKSITLGADLCCLLENALKERGPGSAMALSLADTHMQSLVEDWVLKGEKTEGELEGLTRAIRELLIRAAVGSPQSASFAINALERRAEELAKMRFYTQLNLSRQTSDVADDVYDDFEKFLIESGQS